MACDGRIPGVCLSRNGALGWLFDSEDLLGHWKRHSDPMADSVSRATRARLSRLASA